MRVPREKIEPGEWQREPGPFGRRYRMVGSAIEYEREINGIPESVFFASQEAQRKQREEEREREQREAAERAAYRRNCPFMDSNGSNTDCTREACALFNGTSCTLKRQAAARDTAGLQCPFDRYHRQCRKDCALYKNGCTITGNTTNTESEE